MFQSLISSSRGARTAFSAVLSFCHARMGEVWKNRGEDLGGGRLSAGRRRHCRWDCSIGAMKTRCRAAAELNTHFELLIFCSSICGLGLEARNQEVEALEISSLNLSRCQPHLLPVTISSQL